ncbi:MAG: hypothetical protein ACR2PI_09835 [Hyphomicrobiaceae bacterium]
MQDREAMLYSKDADARRTGMPADSPIFEKMCGKAASMPFSEVVNMLYTGTSNGKLVLKV